MGIQDSADVAESARVDPTADVWHLAQVREDAVLEAGVIVGRGAYVGPGVRVGRNSKIQNYALVYEPAEPFDQLVARPAPCRPDLMQPGEVTGSQGLAMFVHLLVHRIPAIRGVIGPEGLPECHLAAVGGR